MDSILFVVSLGNYLLKQYGILIGFPTCGSQFNLNGKWKPGYNPYILAAWQLPENDNREWIEETKALVSLTILLTDFVRTVKVWFLWHSAKKL